MPLVKISILDNWTHEEKENLHNAVHTALKTAFNIPDWDYFHRIYEFNKSNFKIPSMKSNKFIFLEIYLYPGRKRETKKRLYSEIIKNLKSIQIPEKDIIIQLIEQPLENWGIRGGIPADEINFDYKLDV